MNEKEKQQAFADEVWTFTKEKEAFEREKEAFEKEKEVFEQTPVVGKKPYKVDYYSLKTYNEFKERHISELKDEAMMWVINMEDNTCGKDWKKKPTPGIDAKLFKTPGEIRLLGQIYIMKRFFNITNEEMQTHLLRKQGIGICNYGE